MPAVHGFGAGEYVMTGSAVGHLSVHGSGIGTLVYRLAQIGTPTAVYARADLLPSPLTAGLL